MRAHVIFFTFLFVGCGGMDDSSIGQLQETITSCPKANVAYGEIRAFAIKSPSDYSVPTGLADAITSLYAACQRNPNNDPCACVDGSQATATADKAAWRNILNNLNGLDRSNNAAYICVGTQGCRVVNKCLATPGSGYEAWVQRKYQLPTVAQTPIGTQNVLPGQAGTVYYYVDPGNERCQIFKTIQVCGSINAGTSSNGYTYTCNNPKTTFSRSETVWVLARFTDLWRDHRFKVDAYRNGVYQWSYPTGFNVIGPGGWRQSYFWPSLTNGAAGSWEFRVFIDYDDGTLYHKAASAFFTIQ